MMDSEDSLDGQQQQQEQRTPADMVSSFLLNAPPGELPEVLEDVKEIVRDDRLIEEQVAKVLPRYTKLQLTPIRLDALESSVILSEYNDIGNGRFVDPKTRKSFHYDHLTGIASDYNDWQPDAGAESWRSALEKEWISYTIEHYHEGTGSVFSSFKDDIVTLNACLEGHQFQPKKFWNGRWRSTWTLKFNPNKDKQCDLVGLVKLHVHYYEDGNVQLVSSRNCDQKISLSKQERVAKDVVEAVKKFESDYQRAISENYQTMSDTTFKALRRPLPVIRSKIEWNKLMGYKIGSELKQQ